MMRIRGDLEVGIRNADWKGSGYTPYTCVYPALHHCPWFDSPHYNTKTAFSKSFIFINTNAVSLWTESQNGEKNVFLNWHKLHKLI